MLLTGAPATRAPCRLRAPRRAHVAAARRATPRMAAVAAPAKTVKFVKYQGLGNDFIIIDNRSSPQPVLTPEQAVKLCDRNFGIGGDGVIFALPPAASGQDYVMRIFNNDGSEPEMCGNGIRCLARFVAAADGAAPRAYRVGTGAGVIVPEVLANGSVAVDMGVPVLTPKDVPTTLGANHESGGAVAAPLRVGNDTWRATCVSMGNPHAVVFAHPDGTALDLDNFPLAALGPSFENNAAFPRRTNTEFVTVLSRSRLRMRVWERGAGATLACGTGACATVVAAVLEKRADRHAVVELPGGPLDINWRESDGRIIMTGPAQAVFAGEVALP